MVTRKPGTTTTTTTATAPVKGSKAQAVRSYAQANPEATPKQIAAALTEQGWEKVTATSVSNTLRDAGPKVDPEVFKMAIKSAAGFVKQVGDVKKARIAIEQAGTFVETCGSKQAALAALETYQEVAESVG